jgi:alpha-galactosidase
MRNALQNVLARAPLHRRWWVNDPDCLLLNPHAATRRGTPEPALGEVQAYATAVALTGGSLLLSDDLAHLEPERLQVAQALLPVIGKAGRVLDWFDAAFPRRLRLDLENALGPWSLLACFNWEEAPRRLRLDLAGYGLDPAGEYLAREFWSGEEQVITGGSLQTEEVAAHGAALIALRRVSPGRPQYAGGSLHISQGLEVTAWKETPGELTLLLERPGPAQGEVVLRLPAPPAQAQLDEAAISWRAGRHGCYHFRVEFERTAWLRLSFSE